MTDWAPILRAISPRAKQAVIDEIAPYLDAAYTQAGITDHLEQAHFLSQSAHESDGFKTLFEYGNKDYFKKYDTPAMRKRLGNRKAGDGYRYRGRGIFQLTGLDNYAEGGKAIGVDLVKDPDKAAQGYYAVRLAIWYWQRRHIGPLALADDVRAVTKKINGGYNGLADRKTYLARAKKALIEVDGAPAALLTAADADPEGGIVSRDGMKQCQLKLQTLGYSMVGRADGQAGTGTIAALSAFQHDHGLDTNGQLDKATFDLLMSDDAEQRAIPDSRATSLPVDSTIFAQSTKLVAGAGGVGVLGVGGMANDALSHVQAVKGYYTELQDALSPFSALKSMILDHISVPVVLVGVAVVVGFIAWRIRAARIADHREGRTN